MGGHRVPPPRRATLKRRCSRCGRDKKAHPIIAFSDFHAKTKWPDGTTRTWQSHCKDCQRKSARRRNGNSRRGKAYRVRKPAMTPEERRKRARELYAENRQDPEWVRRRRQNDRELAALRRREAGIPVRRSKKDRFDGTQMVPADPFIEWWTSLNGARPTQREMGESLARSVRRVVGNRQARMHLRIVIAVADVVGTPEVIDELYGGK